MRIWLSGAESGRRGRNFVLESDFQDRHLVFDGSAWLNQTDGDVDDDETGTREEAEKIDDAGERILLASTFNMMYESDKASVVPTPGVELVFRVCLPCPGPRNWMSFLCVATVGYIVYYAR